MRKFLIKVNGNDYEVEVEEIKSANGPVNNAAVRLETPVRRTQPQEFMDAPVRPAEVVGGAGSIKAMMPGTILKLNVNVGDVVRKGQAVLILEAMKMENEVVANQDGKVAGVHVSVGASVNAGDVLITLE